MRLEFFLAAAIFILFLVGWCIRLLSRRENLINLLFLFAVVSSLVGHFTRSRTI
jgi:hypothetical protein